VKDFRACSYTASGTWPFWIFVTTSVQPQQRVHGPRVRRFLPRIRCNFLG
jgi:hypothetical protein